MIHQLGDKKITRDGNNWIADSAKVIGDVHLKNDSSVWFGAVLRGDGGYRCSVAKYRI